MHSRSLSRGSLRARCNCVNRGAGERCRLASRCNDPPRTMTAANAGARTGTGSLPAMSIFHRRRGPMDCFALGKDLDADEEPPPPLREASGGPSVTTLTHSSTIGANGCLLRSSRGCMHVGIPGMCTTCTKLNFMNRLPSIYRHHQFIGLIHREGSLSESDNSRNGCRTEHSRSVKPRRTDMSYWRVQRAVLAGSAALVLAACGGGGSDNDLPGGQGRATAYKTIVPSIP